MFPRVRAFLIHISASTLIALLSLGLVFFVWYPAPLQVAAGVTSVFLTVVGVDVVIGPVLTLIVFKPGKKSLKFDLTVIIILQLAAFVYGLLTVAEGRPAWLVFNKDRFDLVRVYEIHRGRLDETAPEYRNASLLGPRWVAATVPTDTDAYNTLLFESLMTGIDVPQRPDLYKPLEAEANAIRKRLQPMNELLRFNGVEAVRVARTRWPEADGWLPLMSGAKPVVVLMRRDRAEVVAVVDLNPWE